MKLELIVGYSRMYLVKKGSLVSYKKFVELKRTDNLFNLSNFIHFECNNLILLLLFRFHSMMLELEQVQ